MSRTTTKSAWHRLRDSTVCRFCHVADQGFHAEKCPVSIVLNEHKIMREALEDMRTVTHTSRVRWANEQPQRSYDDDWKPNDYFQKKASDTLSNLQP